MTSTVPLPLNKNSGSEMMEDELYHVPNSPIQMGNNRTESPRPHLLRNGSNLSQNGGQSANNLSSLLNVPDTFIEQYQKLNGAGYNNSNNNQSGLYSQPSLPVGEDFGHPWQVPEEDEGLWSTGMESEVNPFNDHGDPNSLNTQHNQNIMPVQENNKPKRFTTLGDYPFTTQKPVNEEYFLLHNPDIQPSQMINKKNFLNDLYDDSLFVPQRDDIESLGAFENNMIDNFDEDIEDDLSEEDEDDDNYFYDDFDDLVKNDEREKRPTVNDSPGGGNMAGGYLDHANKQDSLPKSEEDSDNKGSLVDSVFDDYDDLDSEMAVDDGSYVENTEPQEDKISFEDSKSKADELESTPTHERKDSHRSAAEISSTNPNHSCSLINPSTGQPCMKNFSRPYDLIRHQETIHASKKKIFRCVICEGRVNGGAGNGKLKTFSRGDALSRHIKVKHGLVGKDALNLINDAKENVEYVCW